MTIPISTTLITLKGVRPQLSIDPDADGYDGSAPTPSVLASDVRATITLPKGQRSNPTDEIDSYALRCDPIDGVELTQYDTVIDQTTGTEYRVLVANPSLPEDFGLAHWVATLTHSTGIVKGSDTNESARG